MATPDPPSPDAPHRTRKSIGITLRTALLSWLVTLVTLLTFIAVIIPEQKRAVLQIMEDKAKGVAVSIRDLESAVVNEDYVVVVDYVNELLKEDDTIDHVVLADNDGFGLVLQRLDLGGWYMTNRLPDEWRPTDKRPTSTIRYVPLVERRVFEHAQPFSYSGIDWGWVHVGLSPKAYDSNVTTVYTRTGILAVTCIALSFGISVIYAKRLVRPILSLRQAVRRVTQGDLTARAPITSSDELGSLAQSFNLMADAMRARDQILAGVQFAAQQFLGTTQWRTVINPVLARLGQAAAVSRVYIFENHLAEDGALVSSQRYEWVRDGIPPQIDNPIFQGFRWEGTGFHSWVSDLEKGHFVVQSHERLGDQERRIIESQGIRSLILVPIREEGHWWGFLGMDDCLTERQWSDAERDSLRTAADMLGAAIVRQRNQDALEEAKATLEQRVIERTAELEQQVVAKEQARAELAEAQQRLVQVSRLSGMAEVATGVRHNVGNVLNSVNVSVNLLLDWSRSTKVRSLGKVASLLRDHEQDYPAFFTHDERGRQLPLFLVKLAEHTATELKTVEAELDSLTNRVEHIKQIVVMQQSHATVAGLVEDIAPQTVIEDALRINLSGLERHGITVNREFFDVPMVTVDKHSLLQIVVNLIRNAKDAMKAIPEGHRTLTLGIRRNEQGRIEVRVADTGIGISRENLTRIFSHGFTTKPNGHGFGLHSGALAARAMGGRLIAFSDGPGQGASFVLELPMAS